MRKTIAICALVVVCLGVSSFSSLQKTKGIRLDRMRDFALQGLLDRGIDMTVAENTVAAMSEDDLKHDVGLYLYDPVIGSQALASRTLNWQKAARQAAEDRLATQMFNMLNYERLRADEMGRPTVDAGVSNPDRMYLEQQAGVGETLPRGASRPPAWDIFADVLDTNENRRVERRETGSIESSVISEAMDAALKRVIAESMALGGGNLQESLKAARAMLGNMDGARPEFLRMFADELMRLIKQSERPVE